MAKEWAKPFYNSKRWKRCRIEYINKRKSIDGGMCEVCHENLGFIVHHKKNLTPDNINDADVSINHDNLAYVCKDCHDREDDHFIKRTKDEGRVNVFDSNGNLISLPPPQLDG